MPDTVSTWIVGRNLSFSIQDVQIGDDGSMTLGTDTALTGKLDRATLRRRFTEEEISPLDTPVEHHVPIKESAQVELVEILDRNATSGNVLAKIAHNGKKHAKVVITRGGYVYTYYGMIESYEETYARGKNLGAMTLQIIDVNPAPGGATGAFPTYETAGGSA